MKFLNNLPVDWPFYTTALLMSIIAHLLLLFHLVLPSITLDSIETKKSVSKKILKVDITKPLPTPSNKPSQDSDEPQIESQRSQASALPIMHPTSKPPSDATYYLDSTELSEQPRFPGDLSSSIAPALTGVKPQTILIRLQLSTSGEVEHVILDEADLSDSQQQLLVETISQLKFEPGMVESMVVYSEMNVEIQVPRGN